MILKGLSIARLSSRAAFLSAHGLVLCVAYWLWVIPVQDFFAERDARIASEQELLARLDSVAAKEGAVQELERSANADFNRNEFLHESNEGVAGADLQTRLKSIAGTSGAKVISVQGLAPVKSEAIKYIGVRIELTGTHAAVQRTIYAVESSMPYLFIASAVVKASAVGLAVVVNEPEIDAQLEIFGALQADGGTR